MGEAVPERVSKRPFAGGRLRAISLFAVCLIVLTALLELGLRARPIF